MTGEPGVLQSVGSQRVGRDFAIEQQEENQHIKAMGIFFPRLFLFLLLSQAKQYLQCGPWTKTLWKKESEITQLYLTLCDPMDSSLPGSSIHGIFPGKNTGVGCHFLLQGIFLTQGLNPGLPHCKQTHHLSHQGIPKYCDL